MSSNWSSEIGRIAGIVAMAFFALLTAAQAWRYFRTALGLSVVPRRWLRRKDAKRGKDGQARRRDEVRETDSECGADARTRRDALSGADLRREVSADSECEANVRVRRDVPRDATSRSRCTVRRGLEARSGCAVRCGFGTQCGCSISPAECAERCEF